MRLLGGMEESEGEDHGIGDGEHNRKAKREWRRVFVLTGQRRRNAESEQHGQRQEPRRSSV